jgi:spectinomycin phosphotransferase
LLPIGADRNTFPYRLVADDGVAYFLKLRSGAFNPTGVEVQRWLCDHGLEQVIPPLITREGLSWMRIEPYGVVLYPFVEGQTGMRRPLSEAQWVEFGGALRRLHGVVLPTSLEESVARETYGDYFRERVRGFICGAEDADVEDAIAAALAKLLRERRETIVDLVERAERRAIALRRRRLPTVLCHADMHANNLLLADDGRLFIVDWDTLLHAPKERDLMFIGGGVGRVWNDEREAALFYEGYGPTQIDAAALAYYRCERVVEDVFEYCDEVLASGKSEADRVRALERLSIQFGPGDLVIEIARATDASAG